MFVPATDADVVPIVDLMNRAYRGTQGWSTEQAYIDGDRTTAAFLREDIAATPAASLLKWVEGDDPTPRGCVWLEPLGDDAWYLGSLCVDPAGQDAGQGRTLLAAAQAWMRERGAARVRISVINVRETLIAWYRRRGYEPIGELQPFPYGNDRFGKPLRADLAFVILQKDLLPADTQRG